MGNEKKWLRKVGWCLEVGYIRMQPTPHLISHPPVPPSLLLQPAFSPPHAPFLPSLGLPPSFLSVFLTGLHLLPFLCFLDQLLSLSLSLTLSCRASGQFQSGYAGAKRLTSDLADNTLTETDDSHEMYGATGF